VSDYSTTTIGSATVTVLARPLPVPQWSDAALPAEYRWIFPGSFKDRLGADALAIATSSHDACKAAVVMLADRQYVDLAGPSVASLLDLLIATNQPEAKAMFAGSGPMTEAKRDAILSTPTTEAERYVPGLPQPV